MATRGISVLGATGYTGGLIVRELQRRGVPCLAAGRDAAKLQELAASIGGVETLQADVRDPESLGQLAALSKVIINCVGPFTDLSEPVVRAALEHGSHYLDTTGEQPFVKAMDEHDEWARRQNVAVVPAQAFEVAISDCAAAVAARGCRDINSIRVIYITSFHASQGTKRSLLRALRGNGYSRERGELIAESPGRVTCTLDLPAPLGRRIGVSVPGAEVITIPRHISTREVRTFIGLKPTAARAARSLAPWLRLLARTPLATLATRFIGEGTGGPDAATRGADTFDVVVEVRGVRDGRATRCELVVHGKDPYGLTAVVAAYGAQKMLEDGYRHSGVLAPAVAFDPDDLLAHCRQFGVSWSEST